MHDASFFSPNSPMIRPAFPGGEGPRGKLESFVNEDPVIRNHKRLIAALLIRAIRDLRGEGHDYDIDGRGNSPFGCSKQEAMDDARAWFESDSKEPYSFEWACDMLGREADVVRSALGVRSS